MRDCGRKFLTFLNEYKAFSPNYSKQNYFCSKTKIHIYKTKNDELRKFKIKYKYIYIYLFSFF